MALTPITVNATFKRASNIPAQGYVSFQLSNLVGDTGGNNIIYPNVETIVLDVNGMISTTLLAGIHSSYIPTVTTYKCTLVIDNVVKEFEFLLDDSVSPINLADLIPVTLGSEVLSTLSNILIVKESPETVNTSTTFQNDNELFLPMGINEQYKFEFDLAFAAANETADAKLTVVAPSGATGYFGGIGLSSVVTTPQGDASIEAGALGFSYVVGTDATLQTPVKLTGYVRNGGTAGNLQLQWAQNVSTAADLTLQVNSSLSARRKV